MKANESLFRDAGFARESNREIFRKLEESRDLSGSSRRALAINCQDIGIAEYVLNSDVRAFRSELAYAASQQLSIYQSNQTPDSKIFSHFVTTESSVFILTALASGDFELARQLADFPVQDIYLDVANQFSLMLRHTVMEVEFAEEEFANLTRNSFYKPYAAALLATKTRSSEVCSYLDGINKAHERDRNSKRGFFQGSPSEFLSIWGIGLANLAVTFEISEVECFDSKYIPNRLLLKRSNTG